MVIPPGRSLLRVVVDPQFFTPAFLNSLSPLYSPYPQVVIPPGRSLLRVVVDPQFFTSAYLLSPAPFTLAADGALLKEKEARAPCCSPDLSSLLSFAARPKYFVRAAPLPQTSTGTPSVRA